MLYDRTYMRTPLSGGLKNRTDILIVFLLVIFVVQSVLKFIDLETLLFRTIALSTDSIFSGYIWTPFTYCLFHEGPLHLIFNLIGIHFISRNIELDLGRDTFVLLLLSSVAVGGFSWLFFNDSPGSLIGCSAFVMASLSSFCLRRPNQSITFLLFFVLPLRIKPKFLLGGVLLLEVYGFLFTELNGKTTIAHSAHLGGILVGALFCTNFLSKLKLPTLRFTNKKSDFFKIKQTSANSYKINLGSEPNIETKIDKILDKINENGFASLTDEEKKLLEKAKSLFKDK